METYAAVKINKLNLYAATCITPKETITGGREKPSWQIIWMD